MFDILARILCMKFSCPSCSKVQTNSSLTISQAKEQVDRSNSPEPWIHKDGSQITVLHNLKNKDVRPSVNSEVASKVRPKGTEKCHKIEIMAHCQDEAGISANSSQEMKTLQQIDKNNDNKDVQVTPEKDNLAQKVSRMETNVCSVENKLCSLHSMISDAIKKQMDRKQEETHNAKMENQWLNVALVLDRLFFMIYLIGIVISLIVLFPRSHE